jgi:HK97 family phage portal protein
MGDALSVLRGKRALSPHNTPSAFLSEAGTASGMQVTPETSLRVSAVYAGVRLIAEAVSSLPVDLVRMEGNRRIPQGGQLAELLTAAPNPEMDEPELWRFVLGWMLLRGNAFVYVERNGRGRPTALWPIPATDVSVYRAGGKLAYEVTHETPAGDATLVPPSIPASTFVDGADMLHFRAFGTGTYGLSPITQVREAIGTSLAAQGYMARFYNNDARPGGVIQVDGELSEEAFTRLRHQWRSQHEGLSRSHLLAILEGGAKWESVGLSPGDSEFISTQQWETAEVARALGVPPHMIGDTERSTSWGSGITEQSIGFVQYTLRPWITRLEWVTRHGLLRGVDNRLRLRWRVDGLQRGDIQSRYSAYATARQWGWMSVNDIRSLEDLNPVADGDVYLQPLNMVPAGGGPPNQLSGPPRSGRRSAAGRRRVAQQHAPLVAAADAEVAAREQREIAALTEEYLAGTAGSYEQFLQAVQRLYDGTISSFATDKWSRPLRALIQPVISEAADEAGGDEIDLSRWLAVYVASHISHLVGADVGAIRAALENAELGKEADAVSAVTQDWVANRPSRTGDIESHRLTAAATREVWKAAGVRSVQWIASAGECSYCEQLDGEVSGIDQPFRQKGTKMDSPGGAQLSIDADVHHPPVHPGCECDLVISND